MLVIVEANSFGIPDPDLHGPTQSASCQNLLVARLGYHLRRILKKLSVNRWEH